MAVTLGEAILYLKTDAKGLTAGLKQAQSQVSGAFESIQRHSLAIGTAMTAVGAGITAALGAGVQAAVSFESAFAGVIKTVDATPEELAKLRDGFRDLAKEIPVSVNELAKIGELAGQLGIEKENIIGFTQVIADLGVATNLTGEEAALTLAQFANITGLDQKQFSNLGSAIVGLGNNFATTERDIASMAARLAGAGTTIGLSEADILGLATTLSSLGIEAEAGGSAFSKLMVDLASSVANGGEQLEKFAFVAGKSVSEFVTTFQTSPSQAIADFVGGLGRIQAAGENVFGVLEQMGFTETRLRDALLRSANATGVMTGAIQLANQAFTENTALQDEAAKRYQTTESQFILLKNQIYDVAITIGDSLLPALKDIVAAVVPIVERFGNWAKANPEIVSTITMIASAIGGLMLVLGPLFIMLPGIVTAFGLMKAAVLGVGAVLAGVSAPIVAIVAGIAALIAAGIALYKNWDSVGKWLGETWATIKTTFLEGISYVGEIVGKGAAWIRRLFTDPIGTIAESWQRLTDFVGGLFNKMVDWFQSAYAKISELWTYIKGMAADVINAFTGGYNTGLSGALADGGAVAANRAYLVGERGPEIFVPSSSGRVHSNEDSRGMMGGMTFNIQSLVVREEADVNRIARQLYRMVEMGA